jgi:hypothetical protein
MRYASVVKLNIPCCSLHFRFIEGLFYCAANPVRVYSVIIYGSTFGICLCHRFFNSDDYFTLVRYLR